MMTPERWRHPTGRTITRTINVVSGTSPSPNTRCRSSSTRSVRTSDVDHGDCIGHCLIGAEFRVLWNIKPPRSMQLSENHCLTTGLTYNSQPGEITEISCVPNSVYFPHRVHTQPTYLACLLHCVWLAA